MFNEHLVEQLGEGLEQFLGLVGSLVADDQILSEFLDGVGPWEGGGHRLGSGSAHMGFRAGRSGEGIHWIGSAGRTMRGPKVGNNKKQSFSLPCP